MKGLKEAGTLLGSKKNDEIQVMTKLIPPEEDDGSEELEVSRIPKQYHIVRTFPIFPKEYADQGYRVYNKDGIWHVVLWPSNNPDSREDIQHLSDAVKLMLDEIQGDQSSVSNPEACEDISKAKQFAAQLIQLFDRRATVLRVALDEICRQVSAHCTERGTLLSTLIDDLYTSFQIIPSHYNSTLRVMKKEVDQLRVNLDAKNMEIDSQAKDLNEQISLMQLERRMEKEWHSKLEDQIQKWKGQVETYKKKAQDQIKIERDMLEQQINSLRDVVADLRLENDGLKEQLQFQRSELVKCEKKYAEYEAQIQIISKKNEKLQMQLSKGGPIIVGSRPESSRTVDDQPEQADQGTATVVARLQEDSQLKQLLREYTVQKQLPIMGQREITQATFTLFEAMFNSPEKFAALDDFYAVRLLVTEETPQSAATTARCYMESLIQSEEVFPLARLTLDFMSRKYGNAILKIFINFFGFFKAQPFQGNSQVDHTNDIQSITVNVATNLVNSMFSQALGDNVVKDINDQIKAVAVEERGKESMISIVNVFDLTIQKIVDFYNKKGTDIQNSFARTYARFQRTIASKLPESDMSVPRMDWRTFRDFLRPIRPELSTSEIEKVFMEAIHFSDSIGSVTADAFDTLCVSKQIYISNIKPPGSGKRLRYVPPDMLSVIETAWKTSLRAAVKKAITELSKSDSSTAAVATLRNIDQKLEDILRNPIAGPLCVQMLHEAASIIGHESVSIAASLPIDKCLAVVEKQLTVINTDSMK